MNIYYIQLIASGTVLMESPNCPFEWRGSGDYDEEVSASAYVDVSVVAENEDDAREIAEEYAWECNTLYDVKSVKVLSVGVVEEDVDEEEGLILDECEFYEAVVE